MFFKDMDPQKVHHLVYIGFNPLDLLLIIFDKFKLQICPLYIVKMQVTDSTTVDGSEILLTTWDGAKTL